MSEDPIRKYSDATKELNIATSRVQALGAIIGDVGKALNNKPYELMVSNVGVKFPIEVAMARGIPSLNADNWTTAKQIAEALATLHEKRKRVNDIWSSLSPTDKELVSPPDTK